MFLEKKEARKHAFTLVEVLLVIAIIGVIAAFVIPLVITNASKIKLVSQLQKVNNTFTNMVNHAQADVKMENWNYDSTENFVKTYVIPYINIAKDCGLTEGGCFAEEYTAKNTGPSLSDYYKLALTDGTSIAVKVTPGCSNTNPSECVDFIVDVNSTNTPNVWGKDVFEYQILNDLNAVVPYGSFDSFNEATNKWEFASEDDASTKCLQSDERYCALKIINDGWEMNY